MRTVKTKSPTEMITGNWSKWVLMWVCSLIFIAGMARYWVHYNPNDVLQTQYESVHLARNLVNQGQFANPFVPLDTGPSAHLAPAFPGFAALLIHVFGDGAKGMYALKFAAALVLCIQLALFPIWSRILGMGELNGAITAFLWIAAKVGLVFPPGQWVVMFAWESFYAAFLIMICVYCYRQYLDSTDQDSRFWAVFLGISFGALALTIPVAGFVFVGFVAWVVWRGRGILAKSHLWLVVLLPLLLVAPWAIRNYVTFHRVILTRDNFGLELAVSNNDLAVFGELQNISNGCFAKEHPNFNMEETKMVLALGEANYNRMKLGEAEYWIETHPARFLKLSASRFMAFWMPTDPRGRYTITESGRRLERMVIYILTPLSLVGLFLLYKSDTRGTAICIICLALFPLVYYICEYQYRYRYPILWMTFLLGTLPITHLVQRIYRSLNIGRSHQVTSNM